MVSFIKLPSGKHICVNANDEDTAVCLHTILPFPYADYYLVCCGQRVVDSDPVRDGHTYHVVPRLQGGKGGFGSMLRAIGAQIEKTTSREACRDLSGRRMRDVNNEKKLREWVAGKADREREREERRKQRMERRRVVPKHCFDNPDYVQQKRNVGDNLDDALQEGLKQAGISTESRKRRSDEHGSSTSKKSRVDDGLDSDDMSDLELGSDYSDGDERASPGPQPGSSGLSQSEESSSPDSAVQSDLDVMPSGDEPGISDSREEVSMTDDSSRVHAEHKGMPTGSGAGTPSVPSGIGMGEAIPCPTQTATNDTTPTEKVLVASTEKVGILSTKTVVVTPTETVVVTPTETVVVTPTEMVGIPPTKTVVVTPTEKDETAPAETVEAALTQTTPECKDQYKGPVEVDLSLYDGAEQLEMLGLEVLKAALMARGLKCGGALTERATRLYSVKGLSHDQIKPSLFSKGGKVKGKGKN